MRNGALKRPLLCSALMVSVLTIGRAGCFVFRLLILILLGATVFFGLLTQVPHSLMKRMVKHT